jgi:chloramphenicol-sensitive protein RarD
LTYIWGVNNGYIIEAALGYYINPLVLTLFGTLFFKEKLSRLELVGLAFAFVGVAIKTFSYGQPPFIALILAVSFALYGLFKKKSEFNPLMGLGLETLVVSVPSIIFLTSREVSGSGIIANHTLLFFLTVLLSGIVTAVPLLLYGEGTKRLPLSVVGFLQYIAPTIGLFLGVYVFKEAFEITDLIPFVFIWIGLLFFSYRQFKLMKS